MNNLLPVSQEAPSRPRRAYLNVAKRCNARCVYCADWMNGTDPAIEHPAEAMTAVVDDLHRLGVSHVTVSGGEPLMRKDIWHVVDHILARGMSWSIITNGTMLTRANALRLLEHRVSHVNVSLDALDPRIMRELRGLDSQRIARNVRALSELFASGDAGMAVSIIAVISRTAIPHLPELARFCHRNGIGLTLQPLHREESGRDGDDLAAYWPDGPAIAELEDVLRELIGRKTLDGWRIENSVAYLEAIPSFFRQGTYRPPEPCSTGAVDIVIDTDLRVRPCWAMPAVARITPETPLTTIVDSAPYRQVRARIATGDCPGCLYACHLNRQLS
jgi:MoaA/NifB/PqqE/SkfB family radical SAM enzyme